MRLRCTVNPRPGNPGIVVLPAGGYRRAKAELTGWPGYAPTPLYDLPRVAAECGVDAVRLKDEGSRFGLGCCEALGGAYAVADVMLTELARTGVAPSATTADLAARRYPTGDITVTGASTGNHGRSVAWGAQRFGARCVIFAPESAGDRRADAIAALGAAVRRVPGTYDDAVRMARESAAAEGWLLVADTSWPGYTEVPRLLMQGYRLMADEAQDAWTGPPPTHVFVGAGVGAIAAAVSAQMRARVQPAPRLIVVEPEGAACLFASALEGRAVAVGGTLETVMAELACGEPSLLAWQELERAAWAFLSVADEAATDAAGRLARDGVAASEAGAAGLAGFRLAAADWAVRAALGLDGASRVLLFSTEAAAAAELVP